MWPLYAYLLAHVSLARPPDLPLKVAKDEERASVAPDRKLAFKRKERVIEEQSPWLWFEFTPFEVGCDEIGGE